MTLLVISVFLPLDCR